MTKQSTKSIETNKRIKLAKKATAPAASGNEQRRAERTPYKIVHRS